MLAHETTPAKGGAMAEGAPKADLTGWTDYRPHALDRLRHPCLERGDGPGVIVLHEFPGITPEVLAFSNHLVAKDFTVVMPSFFGTPGTRPTLGETFAIGVSLCVSSEFHAFAFNKQRPVTTFLHALADDLAARTTGRGVGVIGMCFTGGFALATTVASDRVRATVVSQPSIPLPIGAGRSNPGISKAELDRLARRTCEDGPCVLGLRFSRDPISPAGRFKTLEDRLKGAFRAFEIESGRDRKPGVRRCAHSVLTTELRENPPNEAYQKREQVVEFLTKRLT